MVTKKETTRPRAAQRIRVMKRDRFRCGYCGASGHDHELEIDHIIPINAGGSNHISNLITSCRTCNALKRDRLDWSPNTNALDHIKEIEELRKTYEERIASLKDEDDIGMMGLLKGLPREFMRTFLNGTEDDRKQLYAALELIPGAALHLEEGLDPQSSEVICKEMWRRALKSSANKLAKIIRQAEERGEQEVLSEALILKQGTACAIGHSRLADHPEAETLFKVCNEGAELCLRYLNDTDPKQERWYWSSNLRKINAKLEELLPKRLAPSQVFAS